MNIKVLIIAVLLQQVLTQLLYIQTVFRHGARYPRQRLFHNYPREVSGLLTPTGKRAQYLLGKKFYDDYWHQLNLPNYYNSSQMYVRSTQLTRAIESADCFLYGLFAKLKKQQTKFNIHALPGWKRNKIVFKSGYLYANNTSYQTSPIHVEVKKFPILGEPVNPMTAYMTCMKQEEWQKTKYQNNTVYKNLQPLLKKHCTFIQKEFNYDGKCDLEVIMKFASVVHSNISLGKTLHPFLQNKSNYAELTYLFTQNFYTFFFNLPMQVRVVASPYLKEIRSNLRSIINKSSPLKMFIESAHENTIITLLTGFNLTSTKCLDEKFLRNPHLQNCIDQFPGFSSSFVVELHREKNRHYVKLRYNGVYQNMSFCGYKSICLHSNFQRYINKTIVQNFEEVCGNKQYFDKKLKDNHRQDHQIEVALHRKLKMALGSLIGILLIYSVFKLFHYRRVQLQVKAVEYAGLVKHETEQLD